MKLSRLSSAPDRLIASFYVAAILSSVVSASAQNAPSLLPTNSEARQAAAVAASVVPPEHAAQDISRLAGEYSYGNGVNMNCTLEISPDGRFLYKKCSCEKVIDQARGVVSLEDGRVMLQPEKPRETWPRGTAPVMIPVTWDQRLYLVPQNDFVGFSNQINRGIEPVTRGYIGNYYLREGDWDRPASGKPNLPDKWQERLLDKPVTGTVAGQDPSRRWIINLGQDHGVYDDMELSAWSRDLRNFVTLRVTETGTHTSAVEIVGAPANLAIQGWTVYSKITPPKNLPPPLIPSPTPPVYTLQMQTTAPLQMTPPPARSTPPPQTPMPTARRQ